MKLRIGKKVIFWGILGAFCIFVGIFVVAFHETLFQEGNPFSLAVGIADAYFSDSGVGRIPGDPEKYIKPAGSTLAFWQFMESRGWTPVDQMGAELIFENETQGLYVYTRMWTSHFLVYEIGETVDKKTDQTYNWSRERDFFPTKTAK